MLTPWPAGGNFAEAAARMGTRRGNVASPPRRACASVPLVRRSVRMLVTASLAAAFLGPACDGSTTPSKGQLLISWTFADGRSCSEAGVPSVYVGRSAGDYTRLDCASGLGQAVDAGRFPAGPLDVEAVSADGAPLYRAEAEMPSEDPATVSVVLVFVGGAPAP